GSFRLIRCAEITAAAKASRAGLELRSSSRRSPEARQRSQRSLFLLHWTKRGQPSVFQSVAVFLSRFSPFCSSDYRVQALPFLGCSYFLHSALFAMEKHQSAFGIRPGRQVAHSCLKDGRNSLKCPLLTT